MVPRGGRLLTPATAQYGVWAAQQLAPRSAAYNLGHCLEITGPLDVRTFRLAVRETLREAETLHGRYLPEDAGVLLVASGASPEPQPLDLVELGGESDPWQAAQAWMRADLAVPVDLARGPLYGQALFRAGERQHYWYFRVHHIATDGYGLALVIRRIARRYEALAAGREAPDRHGFGPLRDALEEERAYTASGEWELDAEFWTERLKSAGAHVPRRAAVEPVPGPVRVRVPVPGAGWGLLRGVARETGAEWSAALAAAAAQAVCRATGRREAVLALAVANRFGPAGRRTPCLRANLLPLRIPSGRLASATAAAARELAEVRPHARYRYEQLRRDLDLPGGGQSPADAVLNLMPFGSVLRFGECRAVGHVLAAGPVEGLAINIRYGPGGQRPELSLEGNPECWTEGELRAFGLTFLSGSTGGASRGTASGGGDVVLDGGPLPGPVRPVAEAARAWARQSPDAVAVECGGRRVSYRELIDQADESAARLRAEGVAEGDLVAVRLHRGHRVPGLLLGVLLAGAGYLPLDPGGPAVREREVLAAARPAALIDGETGELRLLAEPTRHPGQPAYVLPTSGSTGRPKLVAVGHRALDRFVSAASSVYGIGPGDRVLQFAPLHADTSVEEIFLPPAVGATVVVRDDGMLASVPGFLIACAESGITVLDLPTAFWHELAHAVHTGTAALPPAVRTVVIGGEAASAERVRQWREAVGPGVRLINTYGPTEAPVVATWARLDGDSAADPVPIGRPLPGLAVRVVDDELVLVGEGLADGYLGDAALTGRHFRTRPDGSREYRTGDLVRQRPDGQLVFTGRCDEEVKAGGFRVHPAEVEQALLRHPQVREAVVVPVELPSGGRRLAAHVVAGPGLTGEDVVRHARELLLPAAVPTVTVRTGRLPRTSTGKLDRQALARLPGWQGPLTELEQTVAQVWAGVLGVAGVSPYDDFHALGGSSLHLLQAAHRLGLRLGRTVQAADLLRHPTVAELAAHLRDHPDPTPPELAADAILPPDVVPVRSRPRSARDQDILLTGATGFLGAHLLAELLDRTDARILCTVRAESPEEGLLRIRRAFIRHELDADRLARRVEALPADLARPRLGLAAADWHRAAEQCATVHHCAAAVDLAADYLALRQVNVLGTVEVLRLAAAGPPSAVHLVSTLALRELGPVGGYLQSKWAAERLFAQAAERGLPVSVQRPGRIAGSTVTGVVNPDDLLWRALLEALRTGVEPDLTDLPRTEVWTPVDRVVRALVDATGGVHDLLDPPVDLAELLTWVRDHRYPSTRPATPGGPVDRALVHRYLDHCVRTGLLPAPGLSGSGGARCRARPASRRSSRE